MYPHSSYKEWHYITLLLRNVNTGTTRQEHEGDWNQIAYKYSLTCFLTNFAILYAHAVANPKLCFLLCCRACFPLLTIQVTTDAGKDGSYLLCRSAEMSSVFRVTPNQHA
jgi:hypothetical protein